MSRENNSFKHTTKEMTKDLSKLAKEEGKIMKETGKVVSNAAGNYIDEMEERMKAIATERFKNN